MYPAAAKKKKKIMQSFCAFRKKRKSSLLKLAKYMKLQNCTTQLHIEVCMRH